VTDTSPSTRRDEPDAGGPVVVGIGASAGGLAALKTLFGRVPEDSGVAFVVVVHLSPEHESHLAELLQPHVKLPVNQVTETVALEPDCVYVIPPGRNLTAVDTHLRLSELPEQRRERAPIDHFFRTLAQTHDGNSIGVILTGTGADGSQGIREIKAQGGIVIAQDPNDAQFDGMPQSAIATGAVDWVLPLGEIPDAVLRSARAARRVPRPAVDEALEEKDEALLHKVFAHIQLHTGRDFSSYKLATILRRIGRRMQLRELSDLDQYLRLLREQPEEVRALSDDFLITVTSFFRDPEVFDKLGEDVIPALFEGKRAEDTVRVWSVGCATGEEAYSLAILLLEEAARRESPPRVQVFASDLHEHSLKRAREGFYPGDVAADVGPQRLSRYFEQQEGGYRIRKSVRELVVFAPHDLLADPPFSRIALVVCRNVLIYLQREVQRDVVELFHYALVPDGHLLLGSSETTDASDLFSVEDKSLCLYRKRPAPTGEPRLPVFPLMRMRPLEGPQPERRHVGAAPRAGQLHERVVERFLPPSLLVGPEDRVLHLSERVGQYLVHPGGEPTASLWRLVREELRTKLGTMIHEARQTGRPVRSQPVSVHLDGQSRSVVLDVRPAPDGREEGHVLVLFHELPEDVAEPEAAGDHRDLEVAQERLQAVIEKYETSKEEMRASNEELQSANEELRSTLEELETSKEELQSMNEELQTVNQENRMKVEELAQLSGDLQNLLTSTGIAMLFLDRDYRILRFTPKVIDLFNMRLADRSRPISDLTHRLGYDNLIEDAKSVLDRLTPIEREIQDDGGAWYLTRLLPYRSSDDHIEGVVITFVDISERKRQEEALRTREEQVARELASMSRLHALVGRLLVATDIDGALDRVLEAALEIQGTSMGYVRLRDEASGALRIVAQRGFEPESLEPIRSVSADHATADARAARLGERVVIEDVEADSVPEADRKTAAAAGFRAVQVTPLVDRDGQVLGAVSTHFGEPSGPSEHDLRLLDLYVRQATDFITQLRRQEKVREADRRKEEFLALLSHELRGPLAAIHTSVEILKPARRAELDEPQLSHCREVIGRQAENLRRLVDDLLQVTRVTQGRIELRREPVELARVVAHAVEQSRDLIDQAAHRLSLDLPEEDLWLLGDPTRLEQVVANLLNNAARYTPPGGDIRVGAQEEDGRVLLSVRDSGVGLRAEDLSEIFDMFYQVAPTIDRSQGGLGIGLALVRRLVELHGGDIDAHSDGLGRGSEFVVRLPRIDAPAGTPRPAPPALDPEGSPSLKILKILAVDDDPDVASTLAILLEQWGHEVRTASDGEKAVEVARDYRPDVALLDLGLPKLTGYEVARRIRAEDWGRDMLLIAQTGWGRDEDREQTRTAGFDHHLTKPVPLRRLKQLLERRSPTPEDARS
jgi:two-component system, chemotaxis family, CheB/CheR fusion protein